MTDLFPILNAKKIKECFSYNALQIHIYSHIYILSEESWQINELSKTGVREIITLMSSFVLMFGFQKLPLNNYQKKYCLYPKLHFKILKMLPNSLKKSNLWWVKSLTKLSIFYERNFKL